MPSRSVEENTYLTAPQAAEILGTSTGYVWDLGWNGKLERRKRGRSFAYSRRSVEAYAQLQADGTTRSRRRTQKRTQHTQRSQPSADGPSAREARCPTCRASIVEAPLRAGGALVLLAPAELFARGPCPRCLGRGTEHLSQTPCPTCLGARMVGVSLAAGELYGLDPAGRARAIAPAQRRAGDALHFAHACALAHDARLAA